MSRLWHFLGGKTIDCELRHEINEWRMYRQGQVGFGRWKYEWVGVEQSLAWDVFLSAAKLLDKFVSFYVYDG